MNRVGLGLENGTLNRHVGRFIRGLAGYSAIRGYSRVVRAVPGSCLENGALNRPGIFHGSVPGRVGPGSHGSYF